MNFLGGFEIIDKRCRLYILEGISTKGIQFLYDSFFKETNTRDFIILRNSEILYK